MTADPTRPRAGATLALTGLILLALWLGLARGEAASLIVGAPTAALALLFARMAGAGRLAPRLAPLPGFLLGLLRDIAVSGWDVARRTVSRDPGFAPEIAHYRMRLRDEAARAVFMNAVTLTPGTLSATLRGEILEVHALDGAGGVRGALAPIEARVARLFGEAPPASRRGAAP